VLRSGKFLREFEDYETAEFFVLTMADLEAARNLRIMRGSKEYHAD
jgi:hypothetical protein